MRPSRRWIVTWRPVLRRAASSRCSGRGDAGNDATFRSRMGDYLNSSSAYRDRFVDFRPDLTLGELRGKILVLTRSDYDGALVGGKIASWQDDVTDQISSIVNGSASAKLFIQDKYGRYDRYRQQEECDHRLSGQSAWKGGVGVALQLHELGDGRRDDSEVERTDAQSRHLRLSQSASRLYGRRDDGFCGRYGCLGRRVAVCGHRPEFLLSSPLRPLASGQVSCVCCFRGAEQGGSFFTLRRGSGSARAAVAGEKRRCVYRTAAFFRYLWLTP